MSGSVSVVVRVLTVALILAIAVIVALVGGFLIWIDGGSLATAILGGGAIFAGATGLGLAIMNALYGP